MTLGQKGEHDGEGGSTCSHHMKDALFMMPTPRVLANVVDQLDSIDMADSDTKGDLYEYMLGKIASAAVAALAANRLRLVENLGVAIPVSAAIMPPEI